MKFAYKVVQKRVKNKERYDVFGVVIDKKEKKHRILIKQQVEEIVVYSHKHYHLNDVCFRNNQQLQTLKYFYRNMVREQIEEDIKSQQIKVGLLEKLKKLL